MKVTVQIRMVGNASIIYMDMAEYVEFIKEQSELLGIKEPEKSTRTLVTNVNMKENNPVNEVIKEINKAMRRSTNVRA